MSDFPRAEIYRRDNFTCQYCGASGATDFETWSTREFTIDHVKPLAHGGSDDPSNLVVACRACNRMKGQDDCASVAEAKAIIDKKRDRDRGWWMKNVARK